LKIVESYRKSLEALDRRGMYRNREVFNRNLLDFASNDYLRLSERKELFQRAVQRVEREQFHSPRASMLVNGYSSIHREFEELLLSLTGFQSGVAVGSGFLANFGLIEALVRKGDTLFIDKEYHSSGVVATRLHDKSQIVYFDHNSPEDLIRKLEASGSGGKIIAVEGIYSMEGSLLKREFFDIADRYEALLIVDEAHSVGVVGNRLQGVFDLYDIQPKENHIKMGTLGKALGSYGSYILGSETVIEFLINRSKPIIYSTAPSLFDIALGSEGVRAVEKDREKYKREIAEFKNIGKEIFQRDFQSLIFPIELSSSDEVVTAKKYLQKRGYLVGGIRPPTVSRPILRVIGRVGGRSDKFRELLEIIERREWF
jgi:8-amino-7-oxononanoate synthase